MGCNKPREFLGVKREKVTIDKNQELDLSLCIGGKLRLSSDTPATIDMASRLETVDDEFCIGNGSPYPFLDGTKINIEFDSPADGVPKSASIVGVLYRLVPNPKFKECNCDECTCK